MKLKTRKMSKERRAKEEKNGEKGETRMLMILAEKIGEEDVKMEGMWRRKSGKERRREVKCLKQDTK